jgi:hypothetical protein
MNAEFNPYDIKYSIAYPHRISCELVRDSLWCAFNRIPRIKMHAHSIRNRIYYQMRRQAVLGRKYNSTTGALAHELYPLFWYSISWRQFAQYFLSPAPHLLRTQTLLMAYLSCVISILQHRPLQRFPTVDVISKIQRRFFSPIDRTNVRLSFDQEWKK